jgi:hypothetical protein
MATNNQNNGLGGLGGLGNTTLGDIGLGKTGFGNVSLGNIGLGVAKGVMGTVSAPLGLAFGALSAVEKANTMSRDKSIANAMGRSYGITDVVNSMTGKSTSDIDTDKSGTVSQAEVDAAHGIGMSGTGYAPNSVDAFGLGRDVMSPAQAQSISQGIAQGVNSSATGVGGLGPTGAQAGYTGITGFTATQGVDTNDSNSSSGTGPGGVGGTSSGSSSSSATAGTTAGTSYSSDEQGGGSSGGGGTYICTALYEMGDMKKSIYKYDQIYGKKVDPATYRGYELWGKYVASKLRNRGIVYKVAKPIALTWANQMAYDLSKGKIGKNSLAIKITKTIGEGCCYILGQIFKRRTLWLKST